LNANAKFETHSLPALTRRYPSRLCLLCRFSLSSIQNALFITTSDFHDNAHEYAAGLYNKVILVDGRRLAELMIEHNIGVAPEQPYIIKKIDSDYFEES